MESGSILFCDGLRAGKFSGEPGVTIICGDGEDTALDRIFDRIVLYNAVPHFPNPKRLIKTISSLPKESGRLTIARGAGRGETIDAHHSGSAGKVSNGLMHDLAGKNEPRVVLRAANQNPNDCLWQSYHNLHPMEYR